MISLRGLACLFLVFAGCHASVEHLTFPALPIRHTDQADWYDVNHNGKPDFGLLRDSSGKVNELAYDDDEDGTPDRTYHLGDYANESVPHLIILLDSIPFNEVAKRYEKSEFAWFDPPQKVIPPFPTLSEQIFSRILQCPPLPGMIDDSYDARTARYHHGIFERVEGYHQPWEFRCNYVSSYSEAGLSYLDPREYYRRELAMTKKALDESPDRVTVSYLVSASPMVCKYGKEGCDLVLDGVQQLCLQLLYERHGAIKISICADHGHNFVESKNVLFDDVLTQAGFHVSDSIRSPKDVAIERDGLVTYLGIHTLQPKAVIDAVLKRDEVELAMFLQQDRVIVRDHEGEASIEYRDGKYRYWPVSRDVLGYQAILDRFKSDGKADADGFVSDGDWFNTTVDAEFPDAPHRIWEAFHGLCISPPEVMLTIKDGFCSGHTTLVHFIDMKSTHGGLNQVNSATFLLTMTGRAKHPLRSGDIIPTVAPGYVLPIRLKK